jgi:glutamyl-tRNA reductase
LALLKYFGLSPDSYYQGFHFEGKGALRHLLRVASSLESLVVGEPQSLGQLKESLSWHQQKGFRLDRELERLFQLAFETARKIQSESGHCGEAYFSCFIRHFASAQKRSGNPSDQGRS